MWRNSYHNVAAEVFIIRLHNRWTALAFHAFNAYSGIRLNEQLKYKYVSSHLDAHISRSLLFLLCFIMLCSC